MLFFTPHYNSVQKYIDHKTSLNESNHQLLFSGDVLAVVDIVLA